MPITEAFATRKMCSGAPTEGYAEKRKKKKLDFVTVLKGPGYNPFRAKSGLFTTSLGQGAPAGHDPKDVMRVANLVKEGPKMLARAEQMAKSITTWEKAHRRANAASAAGQHEMAKVFRDRADIIKFGQKDYSTYPKGTSPAPDDKSASAEAWRAKQSQAAQQAASHVHGVPDGGTSDYENRPGQAAEKVVPTSHDFTKPAAKPKKVPEHSPEIKAASKKLKLPGGAGVQTYGEDYNWKQRGGYADSTMKRVQDAAEAAGYNELTSQTGGDATGNVVSHGRTFYHPDTKMELTLDSSYGVTKDDNWHTITLRKKKVVMPLVCKQDGDEQIVYGEVYSPMRPDAQGEYMTAIEIRKMAHEFIRTGKMNQIDLMHGNQVVKGASVVESFVADDEDVRFLPQSWVIGVHVPDPTLWSAIKKGEINGFSMEALVTRHDMDVEVEIPPVVTGLTSKHEDHEHSYFVTYDVSGQFKGGVTDVVNGHSHRIVAGTHTEDAEGHRHRFSSVDNVRILG